MNKPTAPATQQSELSDERIQEIYRNEQVKAYLLEEPVTAINLARAIERELKAAQAAPSAPTEVDGVRWALFPGYLIDHHEGDIITEEGLQGWLVSMIKHPDYLAAVAASKAAPSAKAEPAALIAYIDSRAAKPVQDGEAVDREWIQRTWMECNQDLFAFTKAVQARATLAPVAAQQGAADDKGLYAAALLAVERMRGCAATYIEDHAKDTYPGAIGLRPQDVATMWAQEIHGIDAKAYLDEAIDDLAASHASTPEASQQAAAVAAPSDEARKLLERAHRVLSCAAIARIRDGEATWEDIGKFLAAPTAVAATTSEDARDAARYRWLRNPNKDVGLVLDKRTGWVPHDENIPGIGGYHIYEYRAGDELDAAIDADMRATQQEGSNAS